MGMDDGGISTAQKLHMYLDVRRIRKDRNVHSRVDIQKPILE